jgi:3-oxoacyl-[acyl-carrier protein] reductase
VSGPLAGNRALVTGGSKGIGRAISMAFAGAGADVVIGHFRDGVNAGNTVGEIERRGRAALAIEGDVALEADATALVEGAAEFLGGIDIAVNNAGIAKSAPLLETAAEDFDRVIAVNLRGPFLVGRAALRHMVRQGSGRVINIASELAYLGSPGASAYCASKGGILTMTRSWAREFAPEILVNAIAPGPIDTDLLDFESQTPEQKAQETLLPLGRIGQPEEIGGLAVFLAGPGASYVTGQCYGANGGAVMV